MMWACKTMKEVDEHVTMMNLHRTDYAIIYGNRVKNFGAYVCEKENGR